MKLENEKLKVVEMSRYEYTNVKNRKTDFKKIYRK